LVHDPAVHIYYLVLNRPMNLIDFDFIDKINLILKEISETEGPGVLVTVASGKKVFCSGFNLKNFSELHYPILGATFI